MTQNKWSIGYLMQVSVWVIYQSSCTAVYCRAKVFCNLQCSAIAIGKNQFHTQTSDVIQQFVTKCDKTVIYHQEFMD